MSEETVTRFLSNNVTRSALSVIIGAVSGFLVTPLGAWVTEVPFVDYVLLEAAFFACVGLVTCAFAPKYPFRSTMLALLGIVIGIALEIVVHPTLETGFHRNLFPLEIAFHALIATPSILLAAAIWRGGTTLREHAKKKRPTTWP
jgi:hypothetical protein